MLGLSLVGVTVWEFMELLELEPCWRKYASGDQLRGL